MHIIPQLCCKTRKKRLAAFKMYRETTDFEQKWPYLAQIRFFDENLKMLLLYAYYSATLLNNKKKAMRGFQDVSRNNRFRAKMAIFGPRRPK